MSKKKFSGLIALVMCLLLAFVAQSSAEEFGWPVPGHTYLTTTYYYSSGSPHSCRYWYGGKPAGVDIAVSTGTEVLAPAGGIVQSLADLGNSGFGKYFEIKHDDGTITLYGHLSAFCVENGQRVNRGDVIALSGSTGNSTGPHLHYEMSNRDTYQYYQTNGYRDPRTMNKPEIITSSLPDAIVGQYYTATLSAKSNSPVTFSVSAVSKANGLNCDSNQHSPSNGICETLLTGTVRDLSNIGTYPSTITISITAKNDAGSTTKDVPLTIRKLEITKVPNDSGTVAGQYYTFQCEANGDVSVWSRGTGTIPSGASSYSKSTMPPGLAIGSRTGLISGTVQHTSEGKSSFMPIRYYFKVNASSFSSSATKDAYIPVYEPPVITTNSTLPNGRLNEAYSQTITAEGTEKSMEWKLKSGSLPDGLNIDVNDSRNKRTLTISGTPTREGTYTFTIKLYNLVGNPETTTEKTFTITIGNDIPDPELYIDYTLMNGKVGEYYIDWVIARGRPSINRFTYSGDIPSGLILVRSGMNIYLLGTPKESGTFDFTIKVYSDYGYALKNLRVYISPAIVPPYRPFPDPNMSFRYGYFLKGKLGVPYSDYDYVIGGSSPYTVSTVKGILPPGLHLFQQGSKTLLQGTPTRYGTYTFTIRALGSHNGYVEKELTLVIADNPSYARSGAGEEPDKPTRPKIVTTKLPYAAARNMYTVQLEASGTTPITWSLLNDEIPEGFNLSETGELSGFALEAGRIKFKIKAENSVGSVTKSITLTIKPQKPAITTQALIDGVVGMPYSFTLEAEGTDPITWYKSGSMPSGLRVDKKTGEIYGTPKKAGTYTFKIKAKNKGGTDTVTMQMVINAEEQEKSSAVKSSALVIRDDNAFSTVNTELFVINGDEETDDDIVTEAGTPLTFKVGEWTDESGETVEVSNVKVYVNDELVEGAEVSDNGTFILPGDYVNGEISVCARASYGDSELETTDINVTAEVSSEETSSELEDSSSGSCSINLFGLSGLALCALMAFRKK